jgi:DNA repair exonuclease SbcCD ATPase subunit
MSQPQEDAFTAFLEHYSESLTDAATKDDLLQLGRRLFGASTTPTHTRQSMELLEAKERELSGSTETKEPKVKTMHTTRSLRSRLDSGTQTLTQEQITNEILQLRQKNSDFREDRARREEERARMMEEYDRLVHESVRRKNELKTEIRRLTLELAASLVRSQRDPSESGDSRGVHSVIEDLTDLNRQILQKIGGFKESTRDALAHCERAALDRYKPKMEELLERIYENASDLPVDVIRERFDTVSDEIDAQIGQLQQELNGENARNERLQIQTHQLEERVTAQRDEVSRMKKEAAQLSQEIALLNDLAVAEIAAEKTQYYRLIKDQDDEKAVVLSARATVVSTRETRPKLTKTPSQRALDGRELGNPVLPSVEEFIEQEKARLLESIRKARSE